MAMTKFHTKRQLARDLRKEGSSTIEAGKARDIGVWDPRGSANPVIRESAALGVGEVIDAVKSRYPNVINATRGNNFRVYYNIFGDMERDVMLGENTSALNVHIQWDYSPIEVVKYVGKGQSMTPKDGFAKALRDNQIERKDLSKFSMWTHDGTRNLDDEDVSSLLSLMKQASGNSSKLMRLVKGMLIYSFLARAGSQRVQRNLSRAIVYSPAAVIAEARQANTAYVFSGSPDAPRHNLMLEMMSQAFPPVDLGYDRNVTIPSDEDNVCLVSFGGRMNTVVNGTLTASDAWASVWTYANDMGVTDQVAQATVVAAAIEENRYNSKIGLPRVSSYNDLLQPMFIRPISPIGALPDISKDMMASLGKIYNMAAMFMLKEVVSVNYYKSKTADGWADSAAQYLLSHSNEITRNAKAYGPVGSIITMASELRLLDYIDDTQAEDIMGTSMLESWWLFSDSKVFVKAGVGNYMRLGVADLPTSESQEGRKILEDEMMLAGIDPDSLDLPAGEFTLLGTGVDKINDFIPKLTEWRSYDNERVKDKQPRPKVLPKSRLLAASRSGSESPVPVKQFTAKRLFKTEELQVPKERPMSSSSVPSIHSVGPTLEEVMAQAEIDRAVSAVSDEEPEPTEEQTEQEVRRESARLRMAERMTKGKEKVMIQASKIAEEQGLQLRKVIELFPELGKDYDKTYDDIRGKLDPKIVRLNYYKDKEAGKNPYYSVRDSLVKWDDLRVNLNSKLGRDIQAIRKLEDTGEYYNSRDVELLSLHINDENAEEDLDEMELSVENKDGLANPVIKRVATVAGSKTSSSSGGILREPEFKRSSSGRNARSTREQMVAVLASLRQGKALIDRQTMLTVREEFEWSGEQIKEINRLWAK
nr:putative coat protein [Diaporthe pseudophoenicicola chrysovirus 1]